MVRFNALIKSKYATLVLHGLIWIAVLLLPLFLVAPHQQYVQIGPLRYNFFTLTNVMHIALFYFNAFFLYTHLMTRRRWWFYLLCLTTLVLVFYYIKIWMLKSWFPVLAGEKAAFQFTFFPTVFILAISTIYRLVRDKMQHEKIQTQKEAEHLAMELKFLRSQVSPHFLFNVLNNLVSMARHNSDKLEPSLIKLSGLLRYMLYESDEKKVPIDVEIEYLQGYIDLQKLRFEEDVVIETEIQKGLHSGTLEPMLLIPFVENAFKHGITRVQKPFIRVALSVTDNVLHFRVENKFGEGSQSKDKDSGIGLSNLRARLNLLYPDRHQLSVTKGESVFYVKLSVHLK